MKLKLYLIALILIVVKNGAIAQISDNSVTSSFKRSDVQQAVKVSTDIGVVLLPIATLTTVLFNNDREGFVEGIEAGGVTLATTLLLKYAVREERPDKSDKLSFPSGHTSISFASAMFLQKRYGWKLGVPAFAVATYVGWGRIYAKRHNWWDVLGGALIGTASSYIFTTPISKQHNLSISPYYDGMNRGIYACFQF